MKLLSKWGCIKIFSPEMAEKFHHNLYLLVPLIFFFFFLCSWEITFLMTFKFLRKKPQSQEIQTYRAYLQIMHLDGHWNMNRDRVLGHFLCRLHLKMINGFYSCGDSGWNWNTVATEPKAVKTEQCYFMELINSKQNIIKFNCMSDLVWHNHCCVASLSISSMCC